MAYLSVSHSWLLHDDKSSRVWALNKISLMHFDLVLQLTTHGLIVLNTPFL